MQQQLNVGCKWGLHRNGVMLIAQKCQFNLIVYHESSYSDLMTNSDTTDEFNHLSKIP